MMPVLDKNKYTYAGILLLVMVFISDDTITFGTTESTGMLVFKCLVYLALLMIIPAKSGFTFFTIKDTGYLFLVIGSIVLTSISHGDLSGGYFYQIAILLLTFLIVNTVDFDSFISIYSRIIYALSIVSLVLFAVANSFSWLLSYLPIHENVSGVQYVNLYLGAIYIDIDEIRNMGIFREPGVFMIYLLVGIVIELYYYTNLNVRRFFVYLAALITTFSTAGFIVVSLLIAGYFLKNRKIQPKLQLPVAIFCSVIVYLLYTYPEMYLRIFSKLDADSSKYLSTVAREASVTVNFSIFKDNFLFGAGLNPYVDLFESYSHERYGIPLKSGSHSSNTYMSIFATYGVLYGSILISAIFKLSKMLTLTFLPHMILFLSFLLMFSNEDMRYSIFFYTLVFYGLKYKEIILKVKHSKATPETVSV